MRKTLLLSALFVVTLLPFSKLHAEEPKKIALVSFYGDRRIEMPGLNSLLMEKLLKDSTFNIEKIIKKSYDALVEGLKGSPITIVDLPSVVTNPTYKDYKFKNDVSDNKLVNLAFVSAKDSLKILFPLSLTIPNDELPPVVLGKAFKESGTAEGTLYVNISFKTYSTMLGFRVQANMSVYLFNSAGKKIFSVFPYANSDDQIYSVGGESAATAALLAQKSDAVVLCQQAVDKLINEELKEKFPKMTKKIVKKWED